MNSVVMSASFKKDRKFSLLTIDIGGKKSIIDSDIKQWGDVRRFVFDMLDDNSNDIISVDIRDDDGNWETWKLVSRGGNYLYPACVDTNGDSHEV